MITKMNNQCGSVNIRSEKLYTQNEVNDLHKDWDEGRNRKKETQSENKQKRLNKERLQN